MAMQHIHSKTSLRAAIVELENKQIEDKKVLRDQFHVALESVKPVNLIKGALRDVSSSPDLSNSLISKSANLTVFHFTKVLFKGIATYPRTKLVGLVLLIGVAKVVSNNPETVRVLGIGILRFFSNWLRNRSSNSASEEIY
jgi:hypothetical protein